MENCEPESRRSGCGVMELYNGVFRRSRFWRKAPSSASSESSHGSQKSNSWHSKRRRGGGEEGSVVENLPSPGPKSPDKNLATRPLITSNAAPPSGYQRGGAKPQCNASASVAVVKASAVAPEVPVKKKAPTISQELELVIPEYRSDGYLVRASSSNMMVFGNLGNIRQPRPSARSDHPASSDVLDFLPMTAKEKAAASASAVAPIAAVVAGAARTGEKRNGVAGKTPVEKENPREGEGTMCRALSRRLEPEELKVLGNGEFKNGRFAEALAYYDLAISIDPDTAAYRSNKSAALTGLGRLLEAVEECREAIRLDPSYCRARHRLATLYLRLGEAEKALVQYKQSGHETQAAEIGQAQAVHGHLARCNEARKLKDWHTMLKEAGSAIASGGDSAPQAFVSQAEALLKLHRHQDADEALSTGPGFDPDAATKFFGAAAQAYYTLVRAQVDMAAGRFEEAVAAAHRAGQLDPSNREAGTVARRARAVAAARSRGNELFMSAKFSEACAAYGEGLEHDPLNAVLLCNRAASRSKLGHWEKAIEDCNSALNVRPSYTKARLRRADCNTKLGRWEASVDDYEALILVSPDDEELAKALSEAQLQLKKKRQLAGEAAEGSFCSSVVAVTTDDGFRHTVTSTGVSVVLFSKKTCNMIKQLSFTEKLCKRYPSVKFLKVDIEENPYVARSEGVGSVPSFYIYKNGSKVKDIDGNNQDLLEACVKFFVT